MERVSWVEGFRELFVVKGRAMFARCEVRSARIGQVNSRLWSDVEIVRLGRLDPQSAAARDWPQ